ncbi:Hypothetical protein SMAX5B_018024 [Scophthalmus maximus]|uniref:Uncharacterized protein n=1 Tax=Scophthalmus maximus TaxID=52904 RepID=A0A2U9CBU8_SCOMX|nr:Hypothetical protein SMAX5B_018024 [Scophthalmus maximus]
MSAPLKAHTGIGCWCIVMGARTRPATVPTDLRIEAGEKISSSDEALQHHSAKVRREIIFRRKVTWIRHFAKLIGADHALDAPLVQSFHTGSGAASVPLTVIVVSVSASEDLSLSAGGKSWTAPSQSAWNMGE